MRKIVFFIVSIIMLNSCTQFDFDKYNGTYHNDEYDSNFKDMVGGDIHPQQDWGFYSIIGTRGIDPNANLWSQNWDVLPNVTDDERQAVLDAFNNVPLFMENEVILPWENYWVHQVYTGVDHYTAGNGGDVLGSSKMNHLLCYNADKTESVYDHWDAVEGNVYKTYHYEHCYNFNGGKNDNTAQDEKTGYIYKGAELMLDMNPDGLTPNNQFGFHGTEDSKYHFTYLILKVGDYYYVGFDFEATGDNPNQQVARDGRYTDWIVRISPAYPKGTTPEEPETPPTTTVDTLYYVRVMGEDLGTTDDFDFNDIVIDIAITEDFVAHITLQAAGGTMPIYIGQGTEHEVHKEFGVPVYTMVNTGSGPFMDPVKFDLVGEYRNPRDVEIRVEHGNFIYALTAEVGMVPQKFACPVGTRWLKERHNINTGYEKFGEWATTKAPKNWYDYVTETSEMNLY